MCTTAARNNPLVLPSRAEIEALTALAASTPVPEGILVEQVPNVRKHAGPRQDPKRVM